jgi:hypothetical protein
MYADEPWDHYEIRLLVYTMYPERLRDLQFMDELGVLVSHLANVSPERLRQLSGVIGDVAGYDEWERDQARALEDYS